MRYRAQAAVTLALIVLGLALDLAAPLLLKRLVDATLIRGDLSVLNAVIGGFVALYCVKFVADFASGRLKTRLNENLARDVRAEVYDHLQTLSLPFFHDNRTGYLTSRLFSDSGILGGLLAETFFGLVTNGLLLCGAVAIIVYLNWKLTGVVLLVVPLLAFLTHRLSSRMRKATAEAQEQISQLCGNVQENLSGITVIQSYTMESAASERVGRDLARLRLLNVRLGDLKVVNQTATLLMTSLAGLSILWFGSLEVTRGVLTVGDLMAFLAYSVSVYRPAQALLNINISIQQSLAAAARVFELLDTEPSVKEQPRPIEFKGQVRGAVRYSGVSLAYGERPALSDISFDAEPGMRVAIVGKSGAGKTSLVSLLPRFYDPCAGIVSIDGVDVRRLGVRWLRTQIGIVSQDTFLFSGTIRENLLCGKPDASEAELDRAIAAAQLEGFVQGLPRGLETCVGERGVRISGGERQRISMARALLKNPPILVLDEATSSVDSISESLIKEALRSLTAGRTCLIIAHRLATVRDADRILVLEKGKLVGMGLHQELRDQNGIYAQLCDQQFGSPASAAGEEVFLMEDGPVSSRIVVRSEESGLRQVRITRLPA